MWYVSILASLLILAWGGTCALLFWQLRSQLDHFDVQEIETVEGLLFFAPNGQLRLREDYHNHPESKDVIDRFLEVHHLTARFYFETKSSAIAASEGILLVERGSEDIPSDPRVCPTGPACAW